MLSRAGRAARIQHPLQQREPLESLGEARSLRWPSGSVPQAVSKHRFPACALPVCKSATSTARRPPVIRFTPSFWSWTNATIAATSDPAREATRACPSFDAPVAHARAHRLPRSSAATELRASEAPPARTAGALGPMAEPTASRGRPACDLSRRNPCRVILGCRGWWDGSRRGGRFAALLRLYGGAPSITRVTPQAPSRVAAKLPYSKHGARVNIAFSNSVNPPNDDRYEKLSSLPRPLCSSRWPAGPRSRSRC